MKQIPCMRHTLNPRTCARPTAAPGTRFSGAERAHPVSASASRGATAGLTSRSCIDGGAEKAAADPTHSASAVALIACIANPGLAFYVRKVRARSPSILKEVFPTLRAKGLGWKTTMRCQRPLCAQSPRSRWLPSRRPGRPLLQPRCHPGLVQAGTAQLAVHKRAAWQ